jgi:hypothetical protein
MPSPSASEPDVAVLRSFRSAPARKPSLAEVTTTPVIESRSATRRSTVEAIASRYRPFMVLVLCSGSSSVRMTIPSSVVSQRISGLTAFR